MFLVRVSRACAAILPKATFVLVIAQKRPVVSLEIGLDFSVSALFICEALSKAGGERYIVTSDERQLQPFMDMFSFY